MAQRLKKDGTPAKKPGRPPNPNKAPPERKGFGKGKARPHVWLCGPDKEVHDLYTPWMKARAQAHFRGEDWDLTFEQFYDLWKEDWHQRGRGSFDKCMSRNDPTEAWSVDNTLIITRREHLKKQAEHREACGIGLKGQPVKRKPRKTPEEVQMAYVKMRVDK
jgi:hypothetical protein